MKNYIVQTGATLTGALADGVLNIAGTYGSPVSLLWSNIKKAEYVAYGAGTAQVSTVTISGTLTAGNVISLQISQDLTKANSVGPREKVAIITHVIGAADTVTTIAASIVAQVNNQPLEVVASNASGVITLTATLPYATFSVSEVKDDGANAAITLTGGSNVTGVKPTGFTGAELVAMEIAGASATANYSVFKFIYAFPKSDDKIVAEHTQVLNLYVASTVSVTDLANSLKALDIEDVSANTTTAINAALAQIREYLAKLS